MKTDNNICLPVAQTQDSIFDLFMQRVCKDDEVWIKGEEILINVNYIITDPNYKGHYAKLKTIPETYGLYTQSPVLEINNVNDFKTALFNFIKAFVNKESSWTRPYDKNWMDIAVYSMSMIWTNATNQDFSNPIDFLKRYTAFLTQDQLEDLKEAKEDRSINGIKVWKQVSETFYERETPHSYNLYITSEDGKRIYFPSVCYGIQDDKAYVYAIHQIHDKGKKNSEQLDSIRRYIKGRGVEPLGIATLMSFIEECKKRGITKIIMPDNFIMQYTTKNRQKESIINNLYGPTKIDKIDEFRQKNEEQLDSNQMASLNNRLMSMFLISKYYSTGLKFLEIPGDVSDNLSVDIQNYKIGREIKKQEDRRNKKIVGEER